MPSVTRLARVVRLATLPETRRAIFAAARSEALRDVARRAANDRAALVRDLRSRAKARALLRSAIRHPAARELAAAGLLFLPARYLPVGWAASWAARRVLRRLGPPAERVDVSPVTAGRPPTDVTPERPPTDVTPETR